MRKTIPLVLAALSVTVGIRAQTCADGAKEIAPVMSQETRQKYEKQLDEARLIATTGPNGGDIDSIIWYGRRTAYLGKYKDAIGIFARAMKRWPEDARLYRHRGHRYITLRCFDDAIVDLEKAAKLIKGKADVVEPDGLPNAKNIPTSTLQSNIWYHLGLAYYLKGDMKKAAKAYAECMKVSKNNDMLAATSHWYYMTLRRLEKYKDAEKLLLPFDGDFELIENDDYLKLLRLYRGEIRPEQLAGELGEKAETLGNASLGYGFGNWYLYNGDPAKAAAVFKKILAGDQWASFGYIASENELRKHEN